MDTGAHDGESIRHEFLSDIGIGARIATSGAFTGKTTTGGAADANDVTFTSVTGASIRGHRPLQGHRRRLDRPVDRVQSIAATGLPDHRQTVSDVLPLGITVANKIFKLQPRSIAMDKHSKSG